MDRPQRIPLEQFADHLQNPPVAPRKRRDAGSERRSRSPRCLPPARRTGRQAACECDRAASHRYPGADGQRGPD